MFAQDPLIGLHADYQPPPTYFADTERFNYSESERQAAALFYLGPRGSGVNFHQHTNAWNALLFGAKRWFLFPPYTIFGPTALPMDEWCPRMQLLPVFRPCLLDSSSCGSKNDHFSSDYSLPFMYVQY